jgi:hypothetical protein
MIPTAISDALTALSMDFGIADPLNSAGKAAVTSLQSQAENLVSAIDASNTSISPSIDAFMQPANIASLPDALLGLQQSVIDQSNLSQMRGFIGRVVYNLKQVIV